MGPQRSHWAAQLAMIFLGGSDVIIDTGTAVRRFASDGTRPPGGGSTRLPTRAAPRPR